MVRETSGSENPGETVLTSGEMTPLSSAASQILKMARVIDAAEAADVKAKAELRLSVSDVGEISVTEAIVVSTPGKGLNRKRRLRQFVRAPCRYTPSGDGIPQEVASTPSLDAIEVSALLSPVSDAARRV